MSDNVRCWVVVPAAGVGERVGTESPKQYLPFGDSTVIETSLKHFLSHAKIAGVVVALHANDECWETLSLAKEKLIHTVIGGDSRADSVRNALDYLKNNFAEDNDFVLVHDAARPCLRKEDLDILIRELEHDDIGGLLAAPASDTLKLINQQENGNNVVSKTIDREYVWRAFTPQMFRLNHILEALTYCAGENVKVTDEASAIEALGLQVKLIEGHGDNIKITHPEDLILAKEIYKNINQ